MGFEIRLEDEQGQALESVEDARNVLHRVLPSLDNKDLHCLNRIDWYGDTTFNGLQAVDLAEELSVLDAKDLAAQDRALLRRVIELAVRCKEGTHLYVKFYGD